MVIVRKLFGVLTGVCMALLVAHGSSAQTREKGPWWPSKYGPADQAGPHGATRSSVGTLRVAGRPGNSRYAKYHHAWPAGPKESFRYPCPSP